MVCLLNSKGDGLEMDSVEKFSLQSHLLEKLLVDRSQQSQKMETTFYGLCKEASGHVEKVIEEKIKKKDQATDYIEIHHHAIVGDPLSVKMIKEHIQDFLEIKTLTQLTYPPYYSSLVDAIFQEEYGWGPLSSWRDKTDSQAAKVVGTDIWFITNGGWSKQAFKFRSIEQVLAVCERFKNINRLNKLDAYQNTEMETVTFDGIRVSIVIPDRSFEPVITLRNQTVSIYNLDEQARLGTFAKEALPLIEILSRLCLNSIIAGPPSSGKSSMLMSMLSETAYDIHTAFIESDFEFFPRLAFPGAPIIHERGQGEELEKVVFPKLLRHDIGQVIAAEVRKSESELYGTASERGIKMLKGTFHNMDPVNIPGQLARLNIQHHKQGFDYHFEYLRFAENLHFSITMDELSQTRKRITGIQFYDVDPITLEVSILKIVDYDWEEDTWTYHNEIPKRILRMASKYNRQEVVKMQSLLLQLSKKYPMPEEERKRVSLQASVKV
jgi:pilus assembly protein CpaF